MGRHAPPLHSIRDLATALNVSPQTAVRLVFGEHSSRETIEAAAELLGVPTTRVREMRQETPLQPFRLPPEADQLGQKQRAAIVAVVRAMLEPDDAPMNETQVVADEVEKRRQKLREGRKSPTRQ